MAPNYKITYFDFPGRAEPARLALFLGGIEFEDERVKTDSKAEWEKLKPKTLYGALPTMTLNDKHVTMSQSMAILRYTGKLTGVYPSEAWEAFIADEVTETITDLYASAYSYYGPDKEKVREVQCRFVKDDIPRYWDALERRVKDFGAGPFVLGDRVSTADISIFCFVSSVKRGAFNYVQADALDHCPTLIRIYESFSELPKVKEWYNKRSSS